MRAFLCSIDESVWDAVDIGWTRPEEAKSTCHFQASKSHSSKAPKSEPFLHATSSDQGSATPVHTEIASLIPSEMQTTSTSSTPPST